MPHHADEQAIEDEAARAEADRLTGLALEDLAVEISGALGLERNQLATSQGRTEQDVASWLMRDYPTGAKFLPLLRSGVRRACTFLVRAGVAEYAETAFGVAADGEVTSVTGQLVPTRWGASLVAEGRLGQYIRACWAREHARTPQLESPAEPTPDWAQPAAAWPSSGAARTDWPEPDDDWLPPLDWPSDGTEWTTGNAAAGHLAAAPEWSGPEADWTVPPVSWPAGSPVDWAPAVFPVEPANWPPVPYVPRDVDRLVVEHILPGRSEESPGGAQFG